MKYFIFLNFEELDTCVLKSKYSKIYLAKILTDKLTCSDTFLDRITQFTISSPLYNIYNKLNCFSVLESLVSTYQKFINLDFNERISKYCIEKDLFIVSCLDELKYFMEMFKEHVIISCFFDLCKPSKELIDITDLSLDLCINTTSEHRECILYNDDLYMRKLNKFLSLNMYKNV